MERLARFSLRHRAATLVVLLVLTAGFAWSLPSLRTEFGYRVLVGDDHPAMRKLDAFLDRYGGVLPAVIVWECGDGLPCSTVFDRASLEMAHEVTQALLAVDVVRAASGVPNAPVLVPTDYGFVVRRLVEDGVPAQDASRVAEWAASDPLWVNRLVSSDRTVGAIIVQPVDNASTTDLDLVDALESVLSPHRDRGFEFHLVGDSVAAVVAGRDLARSTADLIPFTVGVIGLILLLLSRSWASSAAALVTMGIALLWTFGLLAWLDWPQDGILEVLAPLILVMGVCDSVHLLARYSSELAESESPVRAEAMLAAVRGVGGACVLTTVTTCVALLSFSTSRLETFGRFGIISATGVAFCLFLTFSLLPILAVAFVGPNPGSMRVSRAWTSPLRAILRVAERRSGLVLISASVLFLVFSYLWVVHLRVDANFKEIFGHDSKVMQWTRFVEERLRLSDTLEVDIGLPPDTFALDAKVLSEVDEFSRYLESLDGLGEARSVIDLLEHVNRLLHGNDSEYERIASSGPGNAELAELVAFEDPGLVDSWVDLNEAHLRISVSAAEQAASRQGSIVESARAYAEERLPQGWTVNFTGEIGTNATWTRDVQATQLSSFPAAVILVLLLVAYSLKSIRLGVVAVLPTILPVVVCLGTMGLVGMSLDIGRAMIAAIVVGIGVDDAIHLLRRYKECRSEGLAPGPAIEAATLHVGRAVITTSLALALGFMTLMASAWHSISSFGFFVALAVLGALVATLFLIPAIIFATARGEGGAGAGRGAAVPARSRSGAIAAGILLPPLLAVGIVAADSRLGTGGEHTPCWVFSNGRVMLQPFFGSCPIGLEDAIEGVEQADGELVPWSPGLLGRAAQGAETVRLQVRRRSGDVEPVSLPVLSSGSGSWMPTGQALAVGLGLLALPLWLVRRSVSAAAAPLGLLYSAVAVIAIAAGVARQSEPLSDLALIAMAMVPAILVHLNLTFLRGRLLVDAPGFAGVPYALSGFLLIAGFVALAWDPLMWPAFIYLLLGLTVIMAGILLVTAFLATRESDSALERVRARVLLYGSVLVPVVPTVWIGTVGHGVSGLAATYLWSAVLTIPFAIALGISRSNLFDLEMDARRVSGQALYVVVGAGGLAVIASVASSRGGAGLLTLAAGGLLFMLAMEAVRRRLIGYMEARVSPRSVELRQHGKLFFENMLELRGPQEVTRLVADTLLDAMGSRAVSVFLEEEGTLRLAQATGERPPARTSIAVAGRDAVEGRAVLQLGDVEEREVARSPLLADSDIELVLPMRRTDEGLGLILVAVSRRGRPYTRMEVQFASRVADQAALALHNARLAKSLVMSELHASTARTALTLVHDLGKQLDWIRSLARRLPQRLDDPGRAARDATRIRDLSDDVAQRARGFLENATRGGAEAGTPLQAVVARAVEGVLQRLPEARVSATVAPGLEWQVVPASVEGILVNLLDNAVRASPPSGMVQIQASRAGDDLAVAVTDRGVGMTPEVLASCQDLGFSTRRADEGHGLGLAVSHDAAEALGGSLALESSPGAGTRATLRLPLSRADTRP